MIDKKELRIGNLLMFGDEYCEVSAIFKSHFNCEKYPSQISIGNNHQNGFAPIPLTAETLQKCGFVLQPQKLAIWIKGRLKLWLGYTGAIAYLMAEDTPESFYIPNNILNLHQLQNLYAALMGEELELEVCDATKMSTQPKAD